MKRALVVVAIAGCAGSYESARPLAPGKVQATADVNALNWSNAPAVRPPETRSTMNGGDVMVRAGIVDRLDAGARFGRTYESESKGNQYSHLLLDAKRELTPAASHLAVSVALHGGLVWSEYRDTHTDQTLVVGPGALVGYDATPTVELVAGASVLWLDPVGTAFARMNGSGAYIAGRLTVGLRFSSPARSWAVQPELGLLEAQGADGFMLSFGVGVAAGN